ncbi:hypothetical protein [Comamonas terrigena]|nr:hypothetical protein [Comamonas terrigena]MDH0047838.1 hypothetical protein [Comamonas terrigena]MDH1090164.1 hypothetical protein [Comamonas terrigena]MDH1500036.1 hypothetical protein [Comamonas terrigena]
MSTTIEDRLILLLKEDGEHHGYWQSLEEVTGISAQRWRKAFARRQRPTTDMFAAICKLYPRYAFWLATGITDAINGHVAPQTALTFPERLYAGSWATNSYFKQSLKLADKLYAEGNVDIEDEKQRMYAVERTQPLAHWIASPLLEKAYELSTSEEYKELQELWQQREQDRSELLPKSAATPTKQGETGGPPRTPILGYDNRTAHQSMFELFFRPEK